VDVRVKRLQRICEGVTTSDGLGCPCGRGVAWSVAEAIASLEPVVQNKQDCPKDRGSDRVPRSNQLANTNQLEYLVRVS